MWTLAGSYKVIYPIVVGDEQLRRMAANRLAQGPSSVSLALRQYVTFFAHDASVHYEFLLECWLWM